MQNRLKQIIHPVLHTHTYVGVQGQILWLSNLRGHKAGYCSKETLSWLPLIHQTKPYILTKQEPGIEEKPSQQSVENKLCRQIIDHCWDVHFRFTLNQRWLNGAEHGLKYWMTSFFRKFYIFSCTQHMKQERKTWGSVGKSTTLEERLNQLHFQLETPDWTDSSGNLRTSIYLWS